MSIVGTNTLKLFNRTPRTKLNGKATTGEVVTTRDDIFASRQKNIHVTKKILLY